MIFTLVSLFNEIINSHIQGLITAERLEQIHLEAQKQFENERSQKSGTPVTKELFIKWKLAFEKELEESEGSTKDKSEVKTKLTGKQLFQKDKALVNSDGGVDEGINLI